MQAQQDELARVPGIQFVDHIAIAVKQGELEGQVKAYETLGFKEVHREEVLGTDQVREVLPRDRRRPESDSTPGAVDRRVAGAKAD